MRATGSTCRTPEGSTKRATGESKMKTYTTHLSDGKKHRVTVPEDEPRPRSIYEAGRAAMRRMSPADEGIAAARRDAAPPADLADEMQTWETENIMAVLENRVDLKRIMRKELIARGVGPLGKWVGFAKAEEQWVGAYGTGVQI